MVLTPTSYNSDIDMNECSERAFGIFTEWEIKIKVGFYYETITQCS